MKSASLIAFILFSVVCTAHANRSNGKTQTEVNNSKEFSLDFKETVPIEIKQTVPIEIKGTLPVQLTGYIFRTDCPTGYDLVGTPGTAENFCISNVSEKPNTWGGAIKSCFNKPDKSHLCTASEWATYCFSQDTNAEKMSGRWEWVSDSGNNYGRVIGMAGCDSFNGAQVDAKYSYRCCFR